MDKMLEGFIKEKIGVDSSDLAKMSETEIDAIYEKAMAIEERLSVKYENEKEAPEELTMAANMVDYIYKL